MEFEKTVKQRRMVPNFTDEPVAREKVAHMLDLARGSCSARQALVLAKAWAS